MHGPRLNPACVGLALLFIMVGCTQKNENPAIRSYDHKLSCERLKSETVRLQSAQKKVEVLLNNPEANAAELLYWIPSAEYGFYPPSQTAVLVDERTHFIDELFVQKDCRQVLKKARQERQALRKKRQEEEQEE